MRVIDNDPIAHSSTAGYLLLSAGKTIDHVYYRNTSIEAPVYIAQTGSTLATKPLSVGDHGYVVDANGLRVWYEENSYDRVIDGATYPFEAVAGASAGGRILGAAQSTTLNQALTTTFADVTGLAKTVPVGTRPIEIVAFLPSNATGAGATGRVKAAILEGATVLSQNATPNVAASTFAGGLVIRAVLEGANQPSVGSHTYKLQAATVTVTSATTASGATFPADFLVREG